MKQTADIFIFGPPGKFANMANGKKCHKIVRRCLLLAVCSVDFFEEAQFHIWKKARSILTLPPVVD